MLNKKVSEYCENQLLEQLSIHHFLGICNQLKWKYRQNSQDNDIDGEIEIFQQEEDFLKNLTTSKYIKVQLKAQKKVEINKKNDYIKYTCPTKLLRFVKNCDYPVILVLYCSEQQKCYWEYLQKVVVENKDKLSQGNLTIQIPNKNILSIENLENFKSEIIKISKEAPLDIQINRKKIPYTNFYEVIDSFYVIKGQFKKEVFHIYTNPIFSENEKILKQIIATIKDEWKKSKQEEIQGLTIYIYDSLNKIRTEYPIYLYEEEMNEIKRDKIFFKNYNRRFINQKKYSKEKSLAFLEEYFNELKLIKLKIEKSEEENENLIEQILSIYNDLSDIQRIEELEEGRLYNIEFPFLCKLLFEDLYDLTSKVMDFLEVEYDSQEKKEKIGIICKFFRKIEINLESIKEIKG